MTAFALASPRRGAEEPAGAAPVRPLGLALRWLPLAGAPVALLAVRGLDVDDLGDYGLPPELPLAWYVALAVLTAGAGVTLAGREFDRRRSAAYLTGLVAVLYGTVLVAADVPRYPWVYKHIGVTRYIDLHGSVDWSIDIYHRWPGFFSLGAYASWLGGTPDPTAWVGWAEPVLCLLNALLVVSTVGAITGRARAGWGAATIFVAANWVGQTYYAPQAFGFLLTLAVYAVLLRHLRRPSLSRPGGVAESLAIRAVGGSVEETQLMPRPQPVWRPAYAITLVLFLFAVIVASHQLTPYMTVFGVGALVVLGGVRVWWLPIAMLAIALGYLGIHLDYINDNFGVFSSIDPFSNMQHSTLYDFAPVAGKVFNDYAGYALTGLLAVLSVLGAVTMLRRRLARQAMLLLFLAAAPCVLIFGQNYGGEATLRVLLFSIPWAGGLAFAALDPWLAGGTRRRLRLVLRQPVVLLLLVALFVPSFYGKDELNIVGTDEVDAANWFYATTPPGSVLMMCGPGFPVRVGATYNQYRGPKTDDDPNLLRTDVLRDRPLGSRQDVDIVVSLIRQYSRSGYLVFARSSIRYAHVYQLVPDGELRNLERAVARSGRFTLAYRNDSVRIYRWEASS
ncbi:hypothetical protein Ade02nite_84760 [Paractinoplanes deccanensis]|uniref:Uncharacterized protein n=1 Tax=Paractinoplanes deccanensis TaxID=113561 RepID=A0ABQ3YIK2_9ACTN|nr:hypothetical protein [Actinoplanes deccanensis]GID79835.1 hypothetical protein Ade02nite_84760 [Actinoplanes deccanensis]